MGGGNKKKAVLLIRLILSLKIARWQDRNGAAETLEMVQICSKAVVKKARWDSQRGSTAGAVRGSGPREQAREVFASGRLVGPTRTDCPPGLCFLTARKLKGLRGGGGVKEKSKKKKKKGSLLFVIFSAA